MKLAPGGTARRLYFCDGMDHGYFLVSGSPYWHRLMTSQTFQFILLAALALSLLFAAYTDLRERIIENWLNLGIALCAPLFWWTTGQSIWPSMAIQLAFGFGVTIVFALVFALGAMGGGDVKLIGALALWIAPWDFVNFLLIMSILGGVLTLVMAIRHRMLKAETPLEVPYGVAIALAGLWWIGERNLNQFA